MASMTKAEQEQASKDRAQQRLLRRAYRLADRQSRKNKDPRAAVAALGILEEGERLGIQVHGITSTEKEVAGHKARLKNNQDIGRMKLDAAREVAAEEAWQRQQKWASRGVQAPGSSPQTPGRLAGQPMPAVKQQAPPAVTTVPTATTTQPASVTGTPLNFNTGETTPSGMSFNQGSPPVVSPVTPTIPNGSTVPQQPTSRLAATPAPVISRGTINGRPTEDVLGPRQTESFIGGVPLAEWRAGKMERAARLRRVTPSKDTFEDIPMVIAVGEGEWRTGKAEEAIEKGWGAVGRMDQAMEELKAKGGFKRLSEFAATPRTKDEKVFPRLSEIPKPKRNDQANTTLMEMEQEAAKLAKQYELKKTTQELLAKDQEEMAAVYRNIPGAGIPLALGIDPLKPVEYLESANEAMSIPRKLIVRGAVKGGKKVVEGVEDAYRLAYNIGQTLGGLPKRIAEAQQTGLTPKQLAERKSRLAEQAKKKAEDDKKKTR